MLCVRITSLQEGAVMFTTMIQLALQNLIYFALHLENNGAFPKKLSKEEERECLKGIANGCLAARNKLIEHNLRLVRFLKNTIRLKPAIHATFCDCIRQKSYFLLYTKINEIAIPKMHLFCRFFTDNVLIYTVFRGSKIFFMAVSLKMSLF
jgi:hypothetical protein